MNYERRERRHGDSGQKASQRKLRITIRALQGAKTNCLFGKSCLQRFGLKVESLNVNRGTFAEPIIAANERDGKRI